MPTLTLLRRSSGIVALGLLLTGLTACEEDEGPEEEPEIAAIRLVIGPATINSTGGNPPATTPSIARGTHNVTVTALAANGSTITLGSDFELRILQVSGVALPFTRTGALTGTINAAAAGQGVVTVQIFHLGEGHEDYEVAALTINVT
jgi:hypothetical protein